MANDLHHRNARWAARIALTLPLCFSAPALAQTPASAGAAASVLQAEDYAARAFEAYGKRDYAEAVALYQMAYDSAPSAEALYNIARVYDLGLRDRPLAIAAYRRYLSDPGASPTYIRSANARLVVLREAELAVNATSPASVSAPVPAAPPTASAVAAGPASEAAPRWSSSQIAGLLVGTAGVASLGVGIGFGVLALRDADRANGLCDENRCRSQRGVDAAKAASTHATIATVGVSAGLGLMATGAALWLAGGGSTEQPAPSALQVAPLSSASEFGLLLSGGF